MDGHGLVYPPNFLNDLPVLSSSPATTTSSKSTPLDIHALAPTQFADLHLQHTLAHPPDNVLFPFLHGLEGDNHAQNTFFASSSFASASANSSRCSSNHTHPNARITPKVPNYRGLVWVVCEDDLEQAGDDVSLHILRRKPLETAQGVAPTPLSSSEDSDSVDTEEEEDEYSESSDFHDDMGEDEPDMLMMIRAESSEAEAEAKGLGFHRRDPENGISIIDDGDDDGGDSPSLVTPVHHLPIQLSDHVRVVSAGADEEEGGVVAVSPEKENKSEQDEQQYEGRHMHPVAHRPPITNIAVSPPVSAPVPVPFHPHGLGITLTDTEKSSIVPASISSTFTSSSVSSPSAPSSTFTSPASTPSSSSSDSSPPSALPTSEFADNMKLQQPPPPPEQHRLMSSDSAKTVMQRSYSLPLLCSPAYPSTQQRQRPPKLLLKHATDPSAPPLLTSTFRPKELVRRTKRVRVQQENGSNNPNSRNHKEEKEDEGSWEFVPTRVPNGISLRNFGIQVPIYATLSDIVIYSPYGATPAALALARRFRTAIGKKRVERMQAAGLGSEATAENGGDGDDDKGFLQYNVFVLSATEAELRATVPQLMMRICGAGVPGGENPASGSSSSRQAPGQSVACGVSVKRGKSSEEYPNSGALEKEQDRQTQDSAGGALSPMKKDATVKKSSSNPPTNNSSPSSPPHCRRGGLLDIGAHTDGPDGHVIELGRVEKEEARVLQKQARKAKVDAAAAEKERDVGMDVDMVNDMDLDVDLDVIPEEEVAMDVDGDAGGVQEVAEQEQCEPAGEDEEDLHLIQNTVDFALREREEMRDLTKASEIISLYPPLSSSSGAALVGSPTSPNPIASTPKSAARVDVEGDSTPVWDPRVGQVFLGNSGDVPLTPDVPTQFRHATSVARDAEAKGKEEKAKYAWDTMTRHLKGVDGLLAQYGTREQQQQEEIKQEPNEFLPEDDPFNYLATNDPENGFGYDICVECHDLAPFPSTAHLRAAEEHLAMMDVMWRERWDRAWAIREQSKKRDGENSSSLSTISTPPTPAPPRPPPHANAVIHLPFPSSPSNSQATLAALVPVVRFFEKWVRPVPVPVVKPPPQPVVEAPIPELKNPRMIGNVDPKRNAAGAAAAAAAAPVSTEGAQPPSGAHSRRWSSVTSLMPSFSSFPGVGGGSQPAPPSTEKNASGQVNVSPAPPQPPPTPLPSHPSRSRAMTSPSSQSQPVHPPTPVQGRTRPLKILLYSSDGYTESSVPALCLLMAIKGLMLPEAYLELQVEKRRSFFVYQSDLGVLRKVEGRLKEEREREKEKEKERERERERERMAASAYFSSMCGGATINANGKRTAPPHVSTRGGYWMGSGSQAPSSTSSSSSSGAPRSPPPNSHGPSPFMGRPAAKSISFSQPPPQIMAAAARHQQQQISIPPNQAIPSQNTVVPGSSSTSSNGQPQQLEFGSLPSQPKLQHPVFSQQHRGEGGGQHQMGMIKSRPRASTSPWLPSLFGGDHQSWFNDPRFDGSFPSRVLPFLYLGNLNHASNVYMLHALGITHVVSVGECALVPPPHHMAMHGGSSGGVCHRPGPGAHFVPGKGPGGHGSLWIEEREGRIKVLDIKGVCDDGIDTLEPQLEPVCDWIDKARQEGGQVLVHCRVGVSRSATVTIAYVMKHLGLPLVDAYLIVRSRRLSVLIQPNMRLLYNLCGWEIKLAKQRANGDERKLKKELARTLTWPYLAKEVHALNEKYLN